MNTFNVGDWVRVDNNMQSNHSYELVAPMGQLAPNFNPVFTPTQMLQLGVFEGKYMTDCEDEYPDFMFENAKFSRKPDPKNINAFKDKSRNPLSYWTQQGWIHAQDPRGWFEWYCRYWLGRRTNDDMRQISRWARFAPRHAGAILAFGDGEIYQRKKTRQALLQWSHDPLPDIPYRGNETTAEKCFRILGIKYESK